MLNNWTLLASPTYKNMPLAQTSKGKKSEPGAYILFTNIVR